MAIALKLNISMVDDLEGYLLVIVHLVLLHWEVVVKNLGQFFRYFLTDSYLRRIAYWQKVSNFINNVLLCLAY